MKPVRLTIILVILFGALAVVAWRSQWFFLHNKATYLLNQRQFEEATDLIARLDARRPDNPRTDFMEVKAATITGDFEKALNVAGNAKRVADAEMLYWLAVAQYQTGNAAEASQTARKFLESGDRMRGASQTIASALAGEARITDASSRNTLDFRLLFDVEKAVYLGLAGLHHWEIGRLDSAAQLLRDAFILGNRNPRFLFDGAHVLALTGDVQSAQMLWDYAGYETVGPLHSKLHQQYSEFQGRSLNLDSDDLARGGRKIDVARALAWVMGLAIKENPEMATSGSLEMMDSLLEEFPYDPVLQVRKAELLEAEGKPELALPVYREVYEKNPSFNVLVRMMAIEGQTGDEIARGSEEFMVELSPVKTIRPDDWEQVDGTVQTYDITLGNDGATTGTFELGEPGSYILTFVAKASSGGKPWPGLQILIDNEVAGVKYICRDTWDTYSLALPLEGGPHSIVLELIHPAETAVNRSLSLQTLYLTLTGVTHAR